MSKTDLQTAIDKARAILTKNNPEFSKAIDKLGNIKSWTDVLDAFPAIWALIKMVAGAVELLNKEYKGCTEDERIDVAAALLDDLITFKGWLAILEPIDGMLFRMLISGGVQALNDKYGKGNWFKSGVTSVSELAG